jgi:hypothetical protein
MDDNNGPLTPALSPSEGEREKHRRVASLGYVKDCSVSLLTFRRLPQLRRDGNWLVSHVRTAPGAGRIYP